MSSDTSSHFSSDDDDFARASQLVHQELSERTGEKNPQPRLEPTRRVADLLGDVHRAFDVIHVTGTNGKTSISRMIEAILRSYGLRTGLFTSPHLRSFNERIQVGGEPIGDDVLVASWLDIKPYVELVDAELVAKGEPRLTYFECLTVLAFAAFADAPVDVAIVEVGMGGEWDSTNIVEADVAVFGPIDIDHADKLGGSLDAIARTKSGIIKPSSIVVSAPQQPLVEQILRDAAEMTESTIYFVDTDIVVTDRAMAVGGQLFSVRAVSGEYEDVFLALFGRHQSQNAAVAIGAVEAFLGGGTQPLSVEVLAEAFATVESPGRLQRIAAEPPVIIDAAHNPHGAVALATAITEFFNFDDVTLVFAAFDDKDADGMLRALSTSVTRVILTTAPSERARSPHELASIARDYFAESEVFIDVDPLIAFERARALALAADSGAVIIAGSISLLGAALTAASENGWT
ncbi:MAG: bifunctional folylpolyglutamate synthase/dihydrofolate synthase [Microbacteriaceae bacterium]